ncbi:MAG: hypothetical protein R3286_19850, partial [Gammaproteobacteria bacterium]|nr:hypothetical protein [Gammaproteobacteria bacterium]
MSLLMDALKRAEKARQAEASSDGAELDPASTQGFSLDPIDDPSAERAAPAERPRGAPPPPPADEFPDASFELENTSQLRDRLEIDPVIEAAEQGREEEIELSGLGDDSLSLDADEIEDAGVLPEDTAATLPSARSARRSVQNYFDGTGSGTGSASLTVDQLQAAMADETQKRERVSADTDTQRRVRAVFHAKEAGRSRRGRNWAVVAVVPLLLLIAVGAVVFVFWDSMTGLLDDRAAVVPREPPPARETTRLAQAEQPAQPGRSQAAQRSAATSASGQGAAVEPGSGGTP